MSALNFPTLPTLNQQYPVPAIPGVPVYTWDGEKWTTYGASITNAFPATALPLMDATPAVVGITSKYAREDHVHPTDTTRADDTAVLKKVPQGLTPTEQTDVRKNVYAAPFDALAYSGMQINGSMEVSQERGTSGTSTDFTYALDGWKLSKNGTMVPTAVQQPSPAGVFPGFPSMLYVVFGTAQASLGTNDVISMFHPIEGYRVARLAWGTANAQSITIAFWSSHVKTGLYSVTARNGANNRSYSATYTQAASSVSQYNVITIPGDTSGTWTVDNSIGLMLIFCVGAGTGYIAPSANTWVAGGYHAAPGQVNGADSTSNAFRITGVVVLPGIEAPSAARSPLIMRPYDQELLTCRRYWQRNPSLMGHVAELANNVCYFTMQHAPPMRTYPTLTPAATAGMVGRPGVAGYDISSVSVVNTELGGTYFSVIITPAALANVPASLTQNAINFDARL